VRASRDNSVAPALPTPQAVWLPTPTMANVKQHRPDKPIRIDSKPLENESEYFVPGTPGTVVSTPLTTDRNADFDNLSTRSIPKRTWSINRSSSVSKGLPGSTRGLNLIRPSRLPSGALPTPRRLHRIDSKASLANSVFDDGHRPNDVQEPLPVYDTGYCLLDALGVSTGELTPLFRPDHFMYTLHVAPGTTQVLFRPVGSGIYNVDGRSVHMPVKLEEPHSTKTVLCVRPKMSEQGQQEGRYLINIVFGYAHESDAEAILPSQTYLVQYNFDAVSAAELSVASGDIVRITDKEDLWWYGTRVDCLGVSIDETFGYMPASFLQPLVTYHDEKDDSMDASYLRPPRAWPEENSLPVVPSTPITKITKILVTEQQGEHTIPPVVVPDKHDAVLVKVRIAHSRSFTFLMMIIYIIMLLVALKQGMNVPNTSTNPMLGADFETLKSLGARWPADIIKGHGVWRLVTQLFVPVGIIQSIIDLVLFYVALGSLEQRCGLLRTSAIFFGSGVVGAATGAFFLPRWLVTGSGPALFGAVAALICLKINIRQPGPPVVSHLHAWLMSCCMGISMIFGTLPGLDNFSLMGGLFAGYLACLAFSGDAIDSRAHIASAFRRLGCFAFLSLAIVVFVLLFRIVDVNAPCVWCMQSTCLPIRGFCGAGRLGGPYINGTLIWPLYRL